MPTHTVVLTRPCSRTWAPFHVACCILAPGTNQGFTAVTRTFPNHLLAEAALWKYSAAWEQVAQGGGGVSFSGDIQDPPEQGPVQPTVGDPASAGRLD